jgi:peptidoglycan/LPS O-acetylase OafA/YrhL
MLMYCSFSALPANKDPPLWTKLHNSTYIALTRPTFILALMICLTNVMIGHGNMLRNIFSSIIWTPLAKLSYSVYLTFPIINSILISSMSQSLFLSYNTMIYLLISNFLLNFAIALPIYLFIEGPMMNVLYHGTGLKKKSFDELVLFLAGKKAFKSGRKLIDNDIKMIPGHSQ